MHRLSYLPIQACSSHIAQDTRMETNVFFYNFKVFLFTINNSTNNNNNNNNNNSDSIVFVIICNI